MCYLAVIGLQISHAVSLLGDPVSVLGAAITSIRAFHEEFDAGIAPDGVHLVQDRVLVALMLVPFLLSTVGSAFTLIGLQVTPIGPPVTPIGRPVTPIGVPVTPVRRQVPLSAGIALGDVVAFIGRPVARLAGILSLRRDLAVQVRSEIASLRRLLTLPRWLGAVDPTLCVLVGPASPHLLRPLRCDPVPLFGDVVARVSHPVTLVGDPVALINHAVTLVGAALALLGLGSHREFLPQWGGKSRTGQILNRSGRT